MANIEKRYLPEAMKRDISTFAELWDEPVGIDPAPVEAERLYLKIKKTMLVLERIAVEAGQLEIEDMHGRQQLRPIFEAWERAQDRFADFTKFALKYDLSARRLELQETQARDVANVVLNTVMDPTLQLEPWQVEKIRTNLAKAMMELGPSLAPDWAKELNDLEEEVGDESI